MISFRFHVVSITAVFLALAIGILVGSTYVDRAIVDNLQSRIDSVSVNLDVRKAENDALETELGQAESYITPSADFAVTDRLTGVPVLVVAMRGIDEAAVAESVRLARQAGGVVPGVVWVEPKRDLANEENLNDMRDAVGGSAGVTPEQLWKTAWSSIAGELAQAPAPDLAASPGQQPGTPLLSALIEAGFLTFDKQGDEAQEITTLAGRGPRVLVVTGSDLAADISPLVVQANAAGGTVLAEVFTIGAEGLARGKALSASLNRETLNRIAIVDNADRTEGQVAAILALAGTPKVIPGHYGYGPDADAVLPAWTPT